MGLDLNWTWGLAAGRLVDLDLDFGAGLDGVWTAGGVNVAFGMRDGEWGFAAVALSANTSSSSFTTARPLVWGAASSGRFLVGFGASIAFVLESPGGLTVRSGLPPAVAGSAPVLAAAALPPAEALLRGGPTSG